MLRQFQGAEDFEGTSPVVHWAAPPSEAREQMCAEGAVAEQPLFSVSVWGGSRLSSEGRRYLHEILERVRRMNELIEHLLKLSHISRCETKRQPVDLSELVLAILQELHQAQPERQVEIDVAPSVVVPGDEPLLRIALENLLNNAWKFSGKEERSRIEFGIKEEEAQPACFVRDNGAGFDMSSATKLFQPFQRLHSNSEFPGIGIGLATVQRIIHRHGGVIWAKSVKNQGTTFYFRI